MATRRRLIVRYPKRQPLEQTIAHKANLPGTRRFLASEGIFVFADGRRGIARVVGDVWLRPAAYRRMSNYLDLQKHASVAGLRISWNDSAPTLRSESLYDDICAVLRNGKGRPVGERRISVQSVSDERGDLW